MLFISHSTADDAHIDALADSLDRAGHPTWVDHRNGLIPGTPSWDKAIREAIAGCTAGVFVMSPRALASDICGSECLLLRELGKPLYVLRLEACEPQDIWLYIKQIQYADLVGDFEGGVGKLIDALAGKTGAGLPVPVRGLITGFDQMRLYLPYLQNPLRGRDQDITLVQSKLGESVLQIVGPGGLGKSRLCAEITLSHPSGAVWHRCASTATSADLLDDLRQHTRLPNTAKEPDILAALALARPLVVIDNAEDVTPEHRKGYADLLTVLIGRGVPVLLTTRTVWHELKPRREHTLTALSQTVGAHIALDFAASNNLPLTLAQAETLAQKARLHPYMIELAVGRLHDPGFDRIIRQLNELTHDDIRDALDEMITKTVSQMCQQAKHGQQAEVLLRRLTVLQGTFTLEAAHALAPDEADPERVEDALEVLQRWQFLRRDRQTERYALAPLVREAVGVLDDPDLFARYARFFTARARAIFSLPREAWMAHEADQPDTIAVGEAWAARFAAGTLSSEQERAALDFALAMSNYCHYRPQALHTPEGVRLRGMNWLAMGLGLAQRLGGIRHQAVFLNQLGLAWMQLGDQQRALVYYEQVLPLQRQVRDVGGEATTLNNIGGVWVDLGAPQKALVYYAQALPLCQQVGYINGEVTTLHNIGFAWNALGDRQKALAYYEQALPLRRQVGDVGGEAATLHNIGAVWDDLGDRQKALDYYEQALPLRRQVGDLGGHAATLNNIGEVWRDLGEPQKALKYLAQALPLCQQVGNVRGEAATLNNIGGVWSALGDRQKALDYLEQALLLRRQIGDIKGEASTLNNIGVVWDALGDQQKALAYYEQALPLLRQVGDVTGEARTLENIGGVWDALGDRQKALTYYAQVLPLLRQVGDVGGEAVTLHNIGGVWNDLGDRQKALTYYTQALPLLRQVGDVSGEATTLAYIGGVWFASGDQQQALTYYEQALPLCRQVGDVDGEAATLKIIGFMWFKLGDQQKALEYLEQALPLMRQVGDVSGEATTLENIGGVWDALGDRQKALTYYAQAERLRGQGQGSAGDD